MAQDFVLSEATAARRRFFLHLVDAADGITPETGEATGQPQISKNGGAFGNTSATLTAVANGLYYVELTAAELDTLGKIVVRYKSANTCEFQDIGVVGALNVFDAAGAGLTNLDATVSSRLASAGYTTPPTVTQIRQEMDTNSADLNTIILALAALSVPTANQNADALLDRASAIDGYTVREILRVAAAALTGKSSGGASDDTVRAIDDSKARITATIDANGHRTAVVVDAT